MWKKYKMKSMVPSIIVGNYEEVIQEVELEPLDDCPASECDESFYKRQKESYDACKKECDGRIYEKESKELQDRNFKRVNNPKEISESLEEKLILLEINASYHPQVFSRKEYWTLEPYSVQDIVKIVKEHYSQQDIINKDKFCGIPIDSKEVDTKLKMYGYVSIEEVLRVAKQTSKELCDCDGHCRICRGIIKALENIGEKNG